mgnify:FL=1
MDFKKLENIIENNKSKEGPLLPIFHEINDFFGYVDKRAIPTIALSLNLSEAEVSGVLSFYHDFKTSPPCKNIIKLCMAEACQSMGCNELYTEISNLITNDNDTTLEKVYCLGNCSLSPAAIINKKYFGRLTLEKLKDFLYNEDK